MAKNTLYSLIDQAMNTQGKTPVGYTVSSYQSVLSALKKAKEEQSEIKKVMGVERIDYTFVGTSTYDNMGMSNNFDIPIWKMTLDITGSCPVQKDNWFDIIKFNNENVKYISRLGNTSLLPLSLDQNISNTLSSDLKFSVGAFIDIGNMAVTYFNKFYVTQGEKFTHNDIAKLVSLGCIHAQIIFPQKNTYQIAAVIGQTSVPNNACCYLTTPILGSNGWKECGIEVKIKENKTIHDFIPNGSEYKFPLLGNTYNRSNGSIDDFDSNEYKKWVDRSNAIYGNNENVLELVKDIPKECYVTLFVPFDKREVAERYLPEGVSDRIFSHYGGKIIREYSANSYVGDSESILLNVVHKWSSVKVNNGNNSVNYSTNRRPSKLVRNKGGIIYSNSEQIIAEFGHEYDLYNYDCSSLVSMILYDSGIIKDSVTALRAFSSDEWATTAVNEINKVIKDEFQAVFMDINETTQIQTGDILVVTLQERLQRGENKSFGHVAMAAPQGGKIYTIEIGSSSEKRDILTHKSRTDQGYYKHLIRIIKR